MDSRSGWPWQMPALCPSQQQRAGSSSAHIMQQSRWHILKYILGLILLRQAPIQTDSGVMAKELLQLFSSQDSTVLHRQAPSCPGGTPGLPFPVSSPRSSVPHTGPPTGHAFLSFADFRALIYFPAFALSYTFLRSRQCVMAENGSLVEMLWSFLFCCFL